MATDLNSVLDNVRKLQKNLEEKLNRSMLVRDLKKYAVAQQKVLKKKINNNADLKRVMGYLEKRRVELDKVTKNLPRELQDLKKYVLAQRKELEKAGRQLLNEISKGNFSNVKKTARTAPKRYSGAMKKVGKKRLKKGL